MALIHVYSYKNRKNLLFNYKKSINYAVLYAKDSFTFYLIAWYDKNVLL